MTDEQPQAPTIGRIVHYRLSMQDAEAINRRYDDGRGPRSASKDHSGAQVHVGNRMEAGETVAMLVTRGWSPECVNGQAFLDGNDSLWLTSVVRGDEPGQWNWPPRV